MKSELVAQVESMNIDQVKDFVRKLGFMDKEKEGGDKIKHFLHLSQVLLFTTHNIASRVKLMTETPAVLFKWHASGSLMY